MTPQPQAQPSSPLSTKFKQHSLVAGIDPSTIVPSDDVSRTTPIHPSILSIKVSSSPSLNPLTLKPWTTDDLKHHNYHNLRTQYSGTPGAAAAAREEAVTELKARLEEAEKRTREVERDMEEKEKTREIERKVWMKRRGEGGAG